MGLNDCIFSRDGDDGDSDDDGDDDDGNGSDDQQQEAGIGNMSIPHHLNTNIIACPINSLAEQPFSDVAFNNFADLLYRQ